MVTLVNRAKMTTATTGTGTITLGSAVSGYQTFAAAGVANTNVVRYVIEDGTNWEIGSGTYTSSGTTLTRTPTESSSAGSAITLSGNAVVFVSATDDDLVPYATGTPVAVTYGGTGVSTSTGSGAVVLGTGPVITGAALNGTVGATTPSTGAFTTVTATSTVSDSAGDVRTLVSNAKVAAYILAATDNGEMINITTGGVTVNSGIFSVGQNVTIYNNSASSQTITQGASVTLRLAGSSTTGSRTLALRGICTIICVASNEFVVSGAGVT